MRMACDILSFTRDEFGQVTSTLGSCCVGGDGLAAPSPIVVQTVWLGRSGSGPQVKQVTQRWCPLLNMKAPAHSSAKYVPGSLLASHCSSWDASGLGRDRLIWGRWLVFPPDYRPRLHRTGSTLREHPLCPCLGWRNHLRQEPLPNISQSQVGSCRGA